MAVILDGKKIASDIKAELKESIRKLKSEGKTVPGLVAILVGDNPASKVYVSSKSKDCEEIGIKSKVESLPEDTTEDELLNLIRKYNNDPEYHGILVQLPLPGHIDENRVIETIVPSKDVDGFHPQNVGNLVIGKDTFYPCTPYGIVEILKRYDIETSGKHVVVVGRSNIVGKPVANMMLQKKEGANSIVTVCHSAAKDLSRFTKEADILIAAIGRPKFIKASMVKEGAVVIDVGINRIEDKTTKSGYRLVGDVDYEEVFEKASYITPVPGGVGLMTRAMLLRNTFEAYQKIMGN
ncbi:methenyltetrahydrofolate cyclohydrolase [Melioribacter roseus P3M-2]|uniref:Bifunctional protein FolD n=1 Tax=Melioribacter roseus (strain DSM 23840 / JCM 17771 / VKM B-2668 / P3M-2) TaxID=1191523 RepID=I7A5H4_MELRP|nr:bifunctional methylenetetrahydrofolate dehydrogenase/methenyltetrahydrofolate cyclohydrolase FolD [Melioribacter roseus]AFN75141.1 methenyltetrahydrofolate cyclohydrolase [Melioribacter roseus P3M-2]